jgi:hypothetical protein
MALMKNYIYASRALKAMKHRQLWLAILAAIVLRVAFGLALYGGGHDIHSFGIWADTMLKGESIYLGTPAYSYGPLWAIMLMGLKLISQATILPFYFLVKLPAIIADACIVMLIYFLLPEEHRIKGAWAYALNPVSILVTSVLPMFDSVALLFTVCAFYLITKYKSMMATTASAICLAIGILTKTFPIFVLPVFLIKIETWPKRILFGAATAAVILLIMAPFVLFNQDVMQENTLAKMTIDFKVFTGVGYQKIILGAETALPQLKDSGLWITATRDIPLKYGNYVSLAAIMLVSLLVAPFVDLVSGIAAVFAAFLFVTSTFSPQYVSWLLPFCVLSGRKIFKHYTIWASIYLGATAITWQVWMNPPLPGPVPSPFQYVSGIAAVIVWIILGIMAFQYVLKAKGQLSIKNLASKILLTH